MGTGVSRTCGSLFGIEDTSNIQSSDNYLKYLYVTSGATFINVSPAFQSGYGSYTVSIPYGYKYVLLTPITADATASVRVDLKVDPSQIDVSTLATDSTLGPSVVTALLVRDDLAEQRVQEEDERELATLRTQADSGVDGAKDLLKRRMSQRKLAQAQLQASASTNPLGNELAKPRSFNIQPLQVGDNQLGVIVTAQNGTQRVYSVKVHRDEWEPNGWQPGSDIDKYRWYYQNATAGNAIAQYRLAAMLSGEDGIVLVPQGQEGSFDLQDPEKFKYVPPSKLVALQEDVCKYQAFKWLQTAAQQKFLTAILKLADLCFNQQVPQRIIEELERAIDSKNTGELSPSAPEYWKREAAQWFLAAANLNHVPSAARLVDMYISGVGVACDYKQATQWLCKTGPTVEKASAEVMARLRTAMSDGSSKAAEQLSLMYIEAPVGVPMDYVQALECLKHTGEDARVISTRVADQFVNMSKRPNPVGAEAAVQLAMMHRDGVGLPVDYKKVLMWLERSGQSKDLAYETVVKWFSELAEREVPSSCEQLGWMYADGVGVHTDYKNAVHWLVRSGMEKEDSEKKVAERLTAAATQGNPRSAYQLALMYVDGAGVDTDYKKALQWLDKAGQQVSQAHKQAAEWFEKQANTGDKRAAYQMALMYIDGVGVAMSFADALKWLEKAGQHAEFAQQLVSSRLLASAEKRNVESSAQLAKMFMDYQNSMQWLVKEGKDEEYFHQNAANWFRVAGEEGDIASSQTLAQMYVDGVGLPIDFKLASYWWEKAGKSKEYSKKKIENKLQSLKPKYRQLFDFYAMDMGRINITDFAGYYRDCLMAKGLSKRKADEETTSTYLGRAKYEALFKSYDVNHDSTLEFEEIWAHPHTHTNLFPKTGQHVMSAEAFFRKWSPEAAAELRANDDLLPPALSRPQSMRSLSLSGALSARNLQRENSKRASLDRAKTADARARSRSLSQSSRNLSTRDLEDWDDARSDTSHVSHTSHTSKGSRSSRGTRSEVN